MSDVVLVTGGSGFIGTWVLRALLARGVNAVAFDVRPQPERSRSILGAIAANVAFVSGSLLDRHGPCLPRGPARRTAVDVSARPTAAR